MPISLRDDFPPTTMGNPLITTITPPPPTPSLRPTPSYKTRTLPPLPPAIPSSQNHHLVSRASSHHTTTQSPNHRIQSPQHPLTPHSHYRRRSFQTPQYNEYRNPSPPRSSAPAVVGGIPYEMQAIEFTPVSEFSSDSEDDDGPGRYLSRTKTLAKDVLFPRKGGNKLRSRKGPGPGQPRKY
ncbi:hypothetical protein EX30DRAFT_75058 [Ascodesmis nigricans]|uniref:Uncharacterized protein n=1 Tax=Ascodesmis nigricans TaxID=341454 RepID=A0A4S2MTC1_9PEZI|nr:hypothetical protein EX30DRAFT_75058 [Ascodesmis nigricans]